MTPQELDRDHVADRTRFVLLTLGLVLVWNFCSSLVGWGWPTAAVISFGVVSLYIGYAWRKSDRFLARVLLFSLVAGFVELLADRWLVDSTRTLVYAADGPFICRSPLYMPFAWAVVLIQLGYLGWWLGNRFGIVAASLLAAAIGAINIPLYEQWAKGAQWWYYRDVPMIGNTPWYIIAGEFLIALTLPAAVSVMEKRGWRISIVSGLAQGLWIWGAYALAYLVLPH